MFNKLIPMEMLARMPLPFVHRLRDIRIKQIEEANRQQELQMRQAEARRNNAMQRYANQQPPPQTNNMGGYAGDPAMYAGTPFEDIIDELT